MSEVRQQRRNSKHAIFAHEIVTHLFEFEDPVEIDGWHAAGGQLSLCATRRKVGERSLQWQWVDGKPLIAEHVPGLRQACDMYEGGTPECLEPRHVPRSLQGGLKVWIYNEGQVGALELTIGADAASALNNPRYRYRIQLGFCGWRAVWIHFEEDARVLDYAGPCEMNSLALRPIGIDAGALYLDHLVFLSFASWKRHSDLQHLHSHSDSYSASRNSILAHYQALPRERGRALAPEVRHDIDTIWQRYEHIVLGTPEYRGGETGLAQQISSWIDRGHEFVEDLCICRDGDVINGRPLFASRDEHMAEDGLTFQAVSQNCLMQLAMDYRLAPTPGKLARFIDLVDYFHDQGWACGHSLGTVNHLIRLMGAANAVALMKDELAAAGRLEREQQTLVWFARLGAVVSHNANVGENTDVVRGSALPKLLSILMMPDDSVKAELLSAFSGYISALIQPAPGWADTIKPDHTLFHHRAAYQSAYGTSTIMALALMAHLLDGTAFAIPESDVEFLRDVFRSQAAMAHGGSVHPGVCGRIIGNVSGLQSYFAGYALLGGMDRLCRYLGCHSGLNAQRLSLTPAISYNGTFGLAEIVDGVMNASVDDLRGPEDGCRFFPYAAMGTYRCDDMFATVRGWSRYVWDFESHPPNANVYGRYFGHGAMFLMTGPPQQGLLAAGLDMDRPILWAYLPGATTKALSLEQLEYHQHESEKYPEGKHRNFTDETFVGGVSLPDGPGMFVLKLRDSVGPDDECTKYDDSFRAVKTYLFLDGKVLCLGRGIANDDGRHDTITTLFQDNVSEGGDEMIDLPSGRRVVTDLRGNSYLVAGGLEVSTEGGCRAWIDHGKAPKAGAYEYLVLPNTCAQDAANIDPADLYRIVQNDASVQIIHFPDPDIWAYAVFEAGIAIGHGPLAMVDTPMMVLLQNTDAGLTVASCDPDLRLASWPNNMSLMPEEICQVPSRARPASYYLREPVAAGASGDFQVARTGALTRVTMTYQHGAAQVVQLETKPC